MNRPVPPADHPMREYAEYMMGRLDEVHQSIHTLYMLSWVLAVFSAGLAFAFLIFAYQKWKERQGLREARDEVVAQRNEVKKLLTVISGWVVVVTATGDRAVASVKDEIAKAAASLPDATADKVVEQIKTAVGGESGIIRNVSQRPSPPPPPVEPLPPPSSPPQPGE